MQKYVRKYARLVVQFILPITLIIYGCVPVPASEPAPAIPVTGPTASEPEMEATEVVAVEPPAAIALTAVKFAAKVFKGGETETEVQENETLSVEANDRIEVLNIENAKEQSHSILDFADFLKVELFTNAVVLLQELREEDGGSKHVTLKLNRGHMFVELSGETNSRVTVETQDTTINTLEAGTKFNICKAPDKLTCIEVEKGSVELVTQGRKEIVKAEQARYVHTGQVPSEVICAPHEIFTDWEARYRTSADAPSLSAMVAGLQELCSWQVAELPPDVHKLYEDKFTTASSGWLQETMENYFIGYSTPEYYHIQIKNPGDRAASYLPTLRQYEDVNIDFKASTGAAKNGDFRYGVAFRRTGDEYYAFAISPSTQKWYVLKSTPQGENILKESIHPGIQSFDAQDTVRVVAKGPTFTFYINGQLVYQLADTDYTRGEVGLFVQSIDSPSALIYFDLIVLWEKVLEPSATALKKENCFNDKDDDGDLFVDKDDPDCSIPDIVPVYTVTPTPTVDQPPTPTPTDAFPTPTPTDDQLATPTPTDDQLATPTPTDDQPPTPTPTEEQQPTPTPTDEPPEPTPTPTDEPSEPTPTDPPTP